MDDEQELPDMVFNLETLLLNVNAKKHCTCAQPKYLIDTRNRLVNCDVCGAVVEPFEAILSMARDRDYFRMDIDRLLQQRKEIAKYKPWLVVIKKLEEMYRRGKFMPTCPNCKTSFDLAELNRLPWSNRDYVDLQRDLEKVNGADAP